MNSLNNIQSKNILVIGDVMLDTYFTGNIKRISPEAPVPIFRKKDERSILGGAANVAANLVAAEQNVSIMAIIGNDETGEKLKRILEEQGINTELLFTSIRHTTEKIRILAGNNQQVLRLDIEDTEPLSAAYYEILVKKLAEKIDTFDLILLSDYLKGLLTYDFTQTVIHKAKEYNIPVIIDVKDSKSEKYAGATLLKPNLKELCNMMGMKAESDEEIIEASQRLKGLRNVEYVLTTCGGRGMVLVGDKEPYFIPSVGYDVYDVTGAGDTTIAYIGSCMANGMTMRESVDISNTAAGIQVSKVGTGPVYWSEIREKLIDQTESFAHKIISGNAIETFRREHKNQKIVFTNGCFDILHVGHIRYLQEAAKLGDILVIGLNSDASVKRLKGLERPINNVTERAELLGALGFVDYVAVFEEDTPLELIKKIHPDVLVKGSDYALNEIVGKKEVEEYGGKLVLIPLVEGKSTTGIINKIKQ